MAQAACAHYSTKSTEHTWKRIIDLSLGTYLQVLYPSLQHANNFLCYSCFHFIILPLFYILADCADLIVAWCRDQIYPRYCTALASNVIIALHVFCILIRLCVVIFIPFIILVSLTPFSSLFNYSLLFIRCLLCSLLRTLFFGISCGEMKYLPPTKWCLLLKKRSKNRPMVSQIFHL